MTMIDLATLKPDPTKRKRRKRVGRGQGSGTGKTCGRGHKGQKARSGYARRIGFEGGQMPLHRRLPKRGFHHRDRFPVATVNLDALERVFEPGAEVTAEALVRAGLASPVQGGIKILGRGRLTKKLTVRTQRITATARKKIEDAGGSVEITGAGPSATRTGASTTRQATEG